MSFDLDKVDCTEYGATEHRNPLQKKVEIISADNTKLRQQVAELEDKAANMERQKFIWQNKAVERGERMKELWGVVLFPSDAGKKRVSRLFDPETGEPL